MRVKDFDFNLPQELIAQNPLPNRSDSRLMVVNRNNRTISDEHFNDLITHLKTGDILVRNNTKVIPARLYGTKEESGAQVEVLLLNNQGDIWECLVGNAKVVKVGTIITFDEGLLKAKCLEVKEEGIRVFIMYYTGIFLEVIERLGTIPLPPYIHEKLEDNSRYQTIYASVTGSVAAPTAGLHFTDKLLRDIKTKGIEIIDVTLQIGLGTFRPIKVDEINKHLMHSEYYEISEKTANILNEAKQAKRRIIAVGTTTCRTLEANLAKYDVFTAEKANTDIFIYPPYTFKAIDCLITNFHLPKSTLIMLVCAFSDKELVLKAYKQAIEKGYRFFSFGDSMLISNE